MILVYLEQSITRLLVTSMLDAWPTSQADFCELCQNLHFQMIRQEEKGKVGLKRPLPGSVFLVAKTSLRLSNSPFPSPFRTTGLSQDELL